MRLSVRESGITFSPFDEARFYYIEKSGSYNRLGKNFSTVEFIFMNRKNQLCFVEVKSSSPRQNGSPGQFETWITKVVSKFCDSLQLFLAVYTERRAEPCLGGAIRHADIKTLPMKFILIIPNHRPEWLAPIQNELKRCLYKTTAMWNIDVAVMNENFAKEYGMICREKSTST